MATTVTTLHGSETTYRASAGGGPMAEEVHQIVWGTTADVTVSLATKLKKLVGAPIIALVGTVDQTVAGAYWADVGYVNGMSVPLSGSVPIGRLGAGAAAITTIVTLKGVG